MAFLNHQARFHLPQGRLIRRNHAGHPAINGTEPWGQDVQNGDTGSQSGGRQANLVFSEHVELLWSRAIANQGSIAPKSGPGHRLTRREEAAAPGSPATITNKRQHIFLNRRGSCFTTGCRQFYVEKSPSR